MKQGKLQLKDGPAPLIHSEKRHRAIFGYVNGCGTLGDYLTSLFAPLQLFEFLEQLGVPHRATRPELP